MAVADDGVDSGQSGNFLRRALGVAAGDQDACGWILPMDSRRKARAVLSACAVTLQVLAKATSARLDWKLVKPRWRNSALMISPSARLARHPKVLNVVFCHVASLHEGYLLKGRQFR